MGRSHDRVDEANFALTHVTQHLQTGIECDVFAGENDVRDRSILFRWESAQDEKEQKLLWQDDWWVPIGKPVSDKVEAASEDFE